MLNIKQLHSPNYGSRCGWKPDMIVCHITEGAYAGAVTWLCNKASGISAHFVVGRDGKIAQLVDLKSAAYCNGTQSGNPLGYEYVGRATSSLVKSRRVNANLYTVSIECEGWTSSTHGTLTDAQFAALVELVGYIRQQVKVLYGTDIPCDRAHLIGHCEIAPKEKPDCPGRDFPWVRLIGALNVLPPITHIDAPVAGAEVVGELTIKGWALQADRIDIYADPSAKRPQPLGSVKANGARPDVGRAYPAYKGAAASGYSLTVPAGVITPGEHTIGVAGVHNSGGATWATAKITVK